ncbi:MAG TPA: redoxin domain-containing protein [Planctomycetaceae bacterium]|nr:redoxin domain-containing protein [Planctomycetaceae bacterium]
MKSLVVSLAILACFPLAVLRAEDTSRADLVGRQIPNFVLPSVTGKEIALADFPEVDFLVIVFLGTECPIGNSYIPQLNELSQKYAKQNVKFAVINANLADSPEEIKKHALEYKLRLLVLVDKDQVSLDIFGATRTPEAFILDRRRNIRYVGRIDDRIGYRFKREQARRSDLEEALKQLIAGETPAVSATETEGCLITRKHAIDGSNEVTYASHIAKLLQTRCQKCHRPNTAAPFSLLTYDDARNWSQMIKETVLTRRMPPWNADPRFGKFENALHMSPKEITLLTSWIDAGMPKGEEDKIPPTPEYLDGWQIGVPDHVFKMPRTYKVQATGTVAYQYFVTPTNFKEDVWIQAAEARPGNWKAVHHIIVYHRPKSSNQTRRLESLGGFAPGEEPTMFPEGVGIRLPAGHELVWQLHYTPTGKEEIDQSEFAVKFCKERPKYVARQDAAINFAFRIPPETSRHKVVASRTINADSELLAMMPHMHVRGKDFKYLAKFPDGRQRTLLSVPFYDFNWQHEYRFAEPVYLPKGTVIECTAHFDNSQENPANPEPSKWVTWGDQTWEEMMIGFFTVIPARER